MRATVNGR